MRKNIVGKWAYWLWLWAFALVAMIVVFSCEQTTGPDTNKITVPRKLLIYSDITAMPANGGSARILVKVYEGDDTTKVSNNVRVQFAVTLGSVQIQNELTDANGYARATVYAGSRSGTMGITSSIENYSNTLFVSITPGAGLVFASPSEILADGVSQSKISATVIDSLGQPLPGALVRFVSTAGTVTAQSYSNEKGRAEAVLRSVASTADVSATVTASSAQGKLAAVENDTPGAAKSAAVENDNPQSTIPNPQSLKPALQGTLGTTTVVFKGITVSGVPGKTTVFANEADSTVVKITAKETTSGAPLAGTKVLFSSTLGKFRAAEGTTDKDGNVSVVFFGSNVSGVAVVKAALAETLAWSAEISLTKQLSMALMAKPSSLPANGTDIAEIKAQIVDSDGNPIQGEKVFFTTTLGTILPSAETDLWGYAAVNLRSTRANGIAEVRAKYKTIEKVTYIEFTGAEIKVQANPMILVANDVSRSTVSITLTDASSSPVVGCSAVISTTKGKLATSDGKSTGTTVIDSTSTTGRITVYLKSSEPGDAVVTVQSNGIKESIAIHFTDYTFSLAASSQEVLAGGGKVKITAALLDKSGKISPINLADVVFSTTMGTITPLERTPAGLVVAELTSGNSAGTATVTASMKNPPISASLSMPFIAADADSLVIKADRMSVRLGGDAVDIRATVYDVTGNPKGGSTVTFTVLDGPGGGEGVSPGSAVTNERGLAVVSFKSGSRGSTLDGVKIQARVENRNSNIISLTIAGEPYSVLIGFGSNFVTNTDGTYGVAVSAIVSDVNRNKVIDGTIVNFSLTKGDVGIIEGQVPTLNGVASTQLVYSPSDAGKEVEVTASAGGIIDRKTVKLPGKAGTIGDLTVSPAETSILGDGIAVASFVINLTGMNSEPLSNMTVYCELLPDSKGKGRIDPSAVTGDPSKQDSSPGKASVVYTGAATQKDLRIGIRMFAGDKSDTVYVNLKGISVSAVAEPNVLPPDGQSKSTINVLVKETSSHIPIIGQEVKFGATNGYIAGKATTDENGLAKTTYVAPKDNSITATNPLNVSVYVTYGNKIEIVIPVTVREIRTQGLELFANPSQIPANGTSTATVTALLRDNNSNPVIGEIIRFTTDLGTITAMDSTDTNGRAEAVLVSDRKNGQARVTAQYKNTTRTIPVNFTGVKMNISATPENLFAGGNEKTTVSAFIKDAAEVAIVGETVTFEWFLNGEKKDMKAVETDVGGKASLNISATEAGQCLIRVTAAGAVDSAYVTFNRMRLTVDGRSMSPVQGRDSLAVSTGGDSIFVWAQLYDTVNDRYVTNSPVEFYTTLGTIGKSAVTNAQGIATTYLKSGSTAGSATVLATTYYQSQRVSKEKLFTFVPAKDAGTVVLKVDPNIVPVNGGSTALIAMVTDKFGNPIADALVSFKLLQGPAGGEYIHPITSTTGTSGVATTYFYSGQVPSSFENVHFQAEVGGVLSNTARITIAGAPETIQPSYPTLIDVGKIDNANGTFTLPISATVLDINSNHVVDGTTVYFKIEPPEGTVNSPVKTANSVAVSQITYPATSAGKTVQLTASAGGKDGKIIIPLPGFTVRYLSVTATPGAIIADGKSTTQIRATLFDNTGSSASIPDGLTVSFTTDGGTLNPAVATTKNGVATTTLTSDKNPKLANITVQSGSAKDVTWVRFEDIVSYLTMSASPKSILADGVSMSVISATLFNNIGEYVPDGTSVSFSTDGGALVNVVAITKDGVAKTQLISGKTPQDAFVTAQSGIARNSTRVTFEDIVSHIILGANLTSIPADGVSNAVLSATVLDKDGNPVQDGVLVSFATDGGTLGKVVVPTVKGVASTTITSTTDTRYVSVRAQSGSVSTNISIRFRDVAEYISIVAEPNTIPADGKSTSLITATLRDNTGAFVQDGTLVSFSSNGGFLSDVVVKTVKGMATTILTSDKSAKEVTVTVKSGALSENVKITFDELVSFVVLTATPGTVAADAQSTCEVKATLKNSVGEPVPDGTVISFTTTDGTLESNVVKTVGGIAKTTLTSSKTPGTVTVTAKAGTITETAKVIFEELGSSVNEVAEIDLAVSNSTIEADGKTKTFITATLYRYNKGVKETVKIPTTVIFDTDIGDISKFVRSDTAGKAVAQFTSGVVGTASISAKVGTISNYTNVIVVPGKPQSIQLTFSPTTVGVKKSGRNETLQISAKVVDNKGNAVGDGNLVRFDLVGAFDDSVSITPNNGVTRSKSEPVPTVNGIATVSFHSGIRAGAHRVQASVVDSLGVVLQPVVSSETTQFMVVSGPAYLDTSNLNDPFTNSRITVAGSPRIIFAEALNTDESKATITVAVADRYNNPVPEGTAVYFTTTGGMIDTKTGFTDAQGLASVKLYAANPLPSVTNSAVVTNPNASLGGPANFTLPLIDFDGDGQKNNGIATVIAYTQGLDQQGRQVTVWNYMPIVFSKSITTFTAVPALTTLPNGQSTVITVTVYDTNKNPVIPGTALSFSSSLGALSTSKITTDDVGRITYFVTLTNNLDPSKEFPGNTIVTVKLKNTGQELEVNTVPIWMSITP